jgi:hypothetical protein
MQFDPAAQRLVGAAGSLPIAPDDEISRKLLMIFEGECEGGPLVAARKFGFSKQRYFQLRNAFKAQGSQALLSQKRGPKAPSKRTDQAVRQVIRQRFLDPDASADVVAQKLRQAGYPISTRSVERVIADYGLQKKTL